MQLDVVHNDNVNIVMQTDTSSGHLQHKAYVVEAEYLQVNKELRVWPCFERRLFIGLINSCLLS